MDPTVSDCIQENQRGNLQSSVLVPFNPNVSVQLACDASPVGIAGVLSHIVNGQDKPILFASGSLTSADKNYSQLDREVLAIVFAVNHFFQYLFGRKFKLITDNQPLARIFHQHAKLSHDRSTTLTLRSISRRF